MKTLFRTPAGLLLAWAATMIVSWSLAAKLLGGVFNSLLEFFGDKKFFSPTSFPFSITAGIPKAVAGAAQYLVDQVNFDPEGTIFTVPGVNLALPNMVILVILMVVAAYFAWRKFDAALETEGVVDDVVAFGVLMVIISVIKILYQMINIVPIPEAFWNILPVVLMSLALWRGKTGETSKIIPFLSVTGEFLLFSFLVWPSQTADGVHAFGSLLLELGNAMNDSPPVMGLLFLIGLGFLFNAARHLDRAPKSKNSGGGSGGGRDGGAK